MYELRIVNPVAQTIETDATLAPRVAALDGKTVGLFWNNKTNGDVALRAVTGELAARYADLTFRSYVGSAGSTTRYMTPDDREKIAAECDLVVASTSD